MNYLNKLYDIPIKAVSIDKRNYSKNEIHEIFVSQSSDYHFTLADSVNEGEYVTHIDIPPEKLEILKEYLDRAIINMKMAEFRLKSSLKNNMTQAKIEKENCCNDDRSLEGWSNIILGKNKD